MGVINASNKAKVAAIVDFAREIFHSDEIMNDSLCILANSLARICTVFNIIILMVLFRVLIF